MDSWSYRRSMFLANGTCLPSDSFAQNRKAMSGFDQRLSTDDVLMSELAHRSFVDMSGKSNGFSAVSISKMASSSSCVVPSSLLPMEMEEKNQSSSSSKFSSVATQDLTRIDFKLRSFLDYRNNGTTSSRAFALPSKKPRASNMSSEKPLCQVYGCNMDLSFSKEYHKKHRVCESHSKTSVVIVSGIEQRFCQQCSRFHFLSEFDDEKRSCRKRLAGHNERRRKPSFYFLPDKRHKLLHTSQDKFQENSSDKNLPLLLPESFPGSLLYRVLDEPDHHASRLVSFKDEHTCSTFPEIGQNSSRISSGVTYNWDLHEAASRSTCALSLLSAQSQQPFSETPNTTFSITQPNHHQMEPLWFTNSGSSSCNGKGSSTVDLLQLSSHLQRIEQQRNITDHEVKQEHNQLYFPCS